MNRRSFLKIAGVTAALGNWAGARTLVLLNVSETAPISRIEWLVYETGRRAPAGGPEHRCVVRISTASGIPGWAEAPAWTLPDADAAASIRSALLDRDLTRRSAIWRELYEQGLPLGTLGIVDVALWDLQGRIEGKPVHALLGTQREKVKAYATTGFNLGDPGQYAEYALACKDKGVHGCKIRPHIEWGAGRNGLVDAGFPDRDVAVYRAVREAVGPDYACMADNFRTYTYDEALRVGRLLDDLGYEWYESPMPESDDWRDRYKTLASELKTPICAPETHPDSYPARVDWISAKACDISRMDVQLGGFTACLELALACEAAGIRLELHDIGPDSYPHLQLIGATPESLIKYVEMQDFVPLLPQQIRTLPGRITPEPALDTQGYVAIPQTPGMGLELDWKYIHAHKIN
jgi:L-alanine-DL-glutamate epimerase-like enolase superfamily enzyme